MKKTTSVIWAGALALGLAGTAQATLFDRGGGLIYDDVLDITWLQDANYAQTSGYDWYGRMGWDEAIAWAENLSYGGYDDWRLPTIIDIGNDGCNYSYNGTDCGYNVQTGSAATTVYSELASLFYDTLGNDGWYDTSGNTTGCNSTDPYCLMNTGPFINLQSAVYWSGAEYAPYTNHAWYFSTFSGNQERRNKNVEFYAWAVRDGDVTKVPEPGTVLLLGAGLIGLFGAGRRQRQRC